MTDAAVAVPDGLDQTKIHFVDVDGVRTRYYEDGAGEPLVLMSGGEFFGSLYSLDAWSLNLPVLARHFHVFAIDKLGQGYTDNPRSEAEYTFDTLLEHTYRLLRAVGLTAAVHLAGHSRGALLGAALTLAHPELVGSTILVDSSSLAPADPRYPDMTFYAELEKRIPPGPAHPPDGAGRGRRASLLERPGHRRFHGAHVPDCPAAPAPGVASVPRAGRPEHLDAQPVPSEGGHAAPHRRRGLLTRTLMIWGFNDRSAPLPLGHALFERIAAKTPRAEMHVLNGAGHYSYRDQYQAFNRVLTSYCLG